MEKTKRIKRPRMQTYSLTIGIDLVAKAISTSDDGNFSKFVREAIKEKIKRIEESKQK